MLLGLLRHVVGRQRGSFAEEKILHMLGYQLLRLLLPGHQAVFVENHLHTLFPELPRIHRHALEDALSELAWPGRSIETGQILLEFHAVNCPAALIGSGTRRR